MNLKRGILDVIGGSVALAVIAVCMLWVVPAFAADKGGPKGGNSFLEVPEPTKAHPWTGCWAGAGLGLAIGELSFGGPGALAADGQKASGHAGCRVQAGMFVGGLEGSYGQMFGDLETLGIDNEMAVTGTLGVLVLPRAQLYGHVSWARLDTAGGDIDGWKFGPGVALQIPNSPLEVDFRYSYGTWDVGSFGGGVDANSHEFGVIAKYRFGAK